MSLIKRSFRLIAFGVVLSVIAPLAARADQICGVTEVTPVGPTSSTYRVCVTNCGDPLTRTFSVRIGGTCLVGGITVDGNGAACKNFTTAGCCGGGAICTVSVSDPIGNTVGCYSCQE